MATTKSGKKFIFNPVKQMAEFNRLIDIARARKRIKTEEQLAVMLNMDRSCLSKRRTGETSWKWEELCRLFRVLEFSAEEVAQAMGVAA